MRGLGGLASVARAGALAGHHPTPPIDQQALASHADLVRGNYGYHRFFHGNWWRRYPDAWWVRGWENAAVVYGTGDWRAYYAYCGYGYSEPLYYDYGSNVVYQDSYVYVNGDSTASEDEYAQQATAIAQTGQQARASKEEPWLPLGVFAMVQGEQVAANDVIQLAVNKSGVIRGNFHSALLDTTLPVYGSVDKTTQRAAWMVGDRKEPVFEAGFANLGMPQTTMLVHFGKDRTQQ